MALRLLTDSCADMPANYYRERGVDVLPLSIIMDGKVFPDSESSPMSPKQFYDKLRMGATSSTSQVNEQEFIEAFTPHLEKGDDILYIGFSGALSGTVKSGESAAIRLREAYPDRRIEVVDSLCASMGQGLLLHYASEKMSEKPDIDTLKAYVEEMRLKVCHWFTVDDLNHLRRGGRVSGASAFLGTMLSIKPVMHVDNEGRLVPVEKVQGRKKSLKALVDHMEATAINPKDQTVFISHGDCLSDAVEVADAIKARMGTENFVMNIIGPVIGSHTGAGVVALFFMGNSR